MNFYELLISPYESYEAYQVVLEILAAFFGLLSVFFSIKKNIWVYPTGIISTAMYVYILFVFGLLGDMMINVYYTFMSIYGWILWYRNSNDHVHIEVKRTSKKEWIFSSGLFLLSLALVTLVYYYKPAIDKGFSTEGVSLGLYHLDWANWLDVFTTSVFLVGMWLMAKQKVENWIFWIVGDLICIPIFIYKGLAITSFQYFVFTAMAVIGYLEWKKSAASSKTSTTLESSPQ